MNTDEEAQRREPIVRDESLIGCDLGSSAFIGGSPTPGFLCAIEVNFCDCPLF